MLIYATPYFSAIIDSMKHKTIYLKDYQTPDYLIETTDLMVELGDQQTLVNARLKVRANGHSGDQKPLVLNGDELTLLSVKIDGRLLSDDEYHWQGDDLVLPPLGEQAEVETQVHIQPQLNTKLMGLYRSNGNFCTQCESQGFRRITYYPDRPDNLAIFTTTIIADKTQYPTLLSNGNLIDQGESDNNRHWVKWHDPHRKAAHLFALVAGKFDRLDDEFVTCSGRKVALQLFVEPGNLDKCATAMQSLKLAMRWDEEVYGREYDLDIFMTVAVSDFNMGAMENKGLNIFNSKYILASAKTATDTDFENILRVVGHEYFHNWSGNRVGCRDWFQLSLKEGFTVFRDQSFTMDMTSAVKRINDVNLLRSMQFKEDAGPMSHPIRPASYMEISNFYTLTVYEKGAEVIRMLHTLLGAEKFRQATDLYFSRFDGQAVTTDDFVDCMQQASGIDLQQFRLWYSQAGTPVLNICDHYDQATQTYRLTVEQHTPVTAGQADKHALHIPLRLGLLSADGQAMTFSLDGENQLSESVLNVTADKQDFVLQQVASAPTPSLLRGFSAPVKLYYPYSSQQLQDLLRHDTDDFSRWQAGQLLALRELQRLVVAQQANKSLQADSHVVNSFAEVLADEQLNKAFKAYLLRLPSEAYVADQMQQADPIAIHQARECLALAIATQCRPVLLDIYLANHDGDGYQQNQAANGRRALKNVCLSYLLQTADEQSIALTQQQFEQATNMTDQIAALTAMVNCEKAPYEEALASFYQQFSDDDLVLDKWFTVQASSKLPGALQTVKRLMTHPAFSLSNPNKVRALIAAFSRLNAVQFHALDGQAYAFLAEQVQVLDALNPQIASRLVEPLTHWQRFSEPHSTLMKQQLQQLLDNNQLSNDSYEIVTKSLQAYKQSAVTE